MTLLIRIGISYLHFSQSDPPVGAPTPAAWGAPTPAAPTPGPWGAPTPAPIIYDTPGDTFSHGIPQTPGVGDSYHSFNITEGGSPLLPLTARVKLSPLELSEKWLLDPKLSSQQGMLAEIRHSIGRSGEGWHGGDYEGEKVIILSVLDTHNENYRSIATVRFLSPHISLDQPVIPVEYLTPVLPDKIGDEVVILQRDRRGTRGKLREALPDSEDWIIQIPDLNLMVEVKQNLLVKVVPVDGS